MGTSANSHRAILCLSAEEWGDVQAIQSKYRRLMFKLHPDKRRDEDVLRAGGKERCDEAVSVVQGALQATKKAAEDDPRVRMQHSMSTRLQEIQKEQARQARQRQHTQQDREPSAKNGLSNAEVPASTNPAARLQDIQRMQALQARFRHQQSQDQETDNLNELLESLSQVASAGSSGSVAPMSQPTVQSGPSTTAKIV